MGNLEELELTRRGFTVLAASAFGAFFIKPKTAIGLSSGKTYFVSVKTIGYGHLWEKEFEDTDWMYEPDEVEVQREALKPGAILRFEQDPDIPKDAAWLESSLKTAKNSATSPGARRQKKRQPS